MQVRLLRRTDDTVGTVRFIGEVGFADGTWIGVELDRRGELILSFGEHCLRKENESNDIQPLQLAKTMVR
jgi:hypothetical protein